MKLTESTLIANIIQEGKTLSLTLLFPDVVESIQSCLSGTADFLKQVKSKKEPTALVYEDTKGNMSAAAIVEYLEGEDGNPGNWTLVFTFDQDDVKGKDGIKTFSIYGSGPKEVIAKRAFDDFRLRYSSPDYLSQIDSMFFQLLYDFLDQNAVEGEKFTLTHEGYFEASVEVVDGEKVMTFIPDGAIKRLIKDDDSASEGATK